MGAGTLVLRRLGYANEFLRSPKITDIWPFMAVFPVTARYFLRPYVYIFRVYVKKGRPAGFLCRYSSSAHLSLDHPHMLPSSGLFFVETNACVSCPRVPLRFRRGVNHGKPGFFPQRVAAKMVLPTSAGEPFSPCALYIYYTFI